MFAGSTSLCWDSGGGGEGKNQNRPTSINSDSSDESDDDIVSLDSPLDSPVEQQQQQQLSLPSCDVDVTLQIPLSHGSTTTISLKSSPHRLQSNHFSLQSYPYKTKSHQRKLCRLLSMSFLRIPVMVTPALMIMIKILQLLKM